MSNDGTLQRRNLGHSGGTRLNLFFWFSGRVTFQSLFRPFSGTPHKTVGLPTQPAYVRYAHQRYVPINPIFCVCFCTVRRYKLTLDLCGTSDGAYSGWLEPTTSLHFGLFQEKLPGATCSIYVGFVLALVYFFFLNVGNTKIKVDFAHLMFWLAGLG